jgi:hypothetical protein
MMKIETLSSSSIRASQTGDSICDPCSFDTSQFDGSISSKLDSGYGSGMVSDLEQLSVSEDPSSTGPDVPNPEASAPSATTILADNQESPSTQDTSFQHSSQSTSTTSTGNEVVSQQGALRESSPVPIRIGIAEFQNLSQFEDDGSYTARFDEITHAIERPLFHSLVPKNRLRLRKTSAQGSVVIRGFILGHTFEDRKPYMVFICNATQKPKIDNFLSRQQQVFQPQGLPHLAVEIMVVCVPKPLKLHAAVAGVTVEMSEFETFEDIDLSNTTLCGTPIRLYNTTSGHDRNATLGGVLKIIDKDNNVMFYGMTAGHLISDWIAPDVEEDNVSLRSESVSSGEEVEEASVVTPTDISDTEADASCGTDETSTLNSPNASKRSELTRLWAFRKFKTLGGLYTTTSSTNLDWAVYVLDHWKLNALVQADKIAHDLIELPVKPHEKTRQSVTILTASSGLIKGILQCGYAKLAVNPGDHPVNVIIISLDKGHSKFFSFQEQTRHPYC